MSSGYEMYDPRMAQRATEAPRFGGAMQNPRMDPPRRDAQRVIERELQDINTPLPFGMQIPENVMRPAAPPNPQPMQSNIRDLIQRLRGQTPNQVAPAPEPPQPGMMRSVLRRDQ